MKRAIVIWKIIGALRGGSGSVLAICNEGLYVVKCPFNPQGPGTLANELLGVELMKAIGLPVPAWSPALYSDSVVCPICQEMSATRPGKAPVPHFASRLISTDLNRDCTSPLPARLVQKLRNRADFVGALVFDTWAGTCDARQAVYTDSPNGEIIDATFIDNGHLFGGPNWDFEGATAGRAICSDVAVYPTPIDPMSVKGWTERIQSVVPHLLPVFMAQVPAEWKPRGEARHIKHLLGRLRDLEKNAWTGISQIQPTSAPTLSRTPDSLRPLRMDLPKGVIESARLLDSLRLRPLVH